MAEIKTDFKDRLSSLFNLVSNIRFIGTTFRLVPTVDYHAVQTEHNYKIIPATAGNTEYQWDVPEGSSIIIEYGRLELIADATVTNRRVIMRIRNKAASREQSYQRNTTNITAGQTKTVLLSREDYTNTITEFHGDIVGLFLTPLEIMDDDKICFSIENGQAGDSYSVGIRYRQIPQPRSYQQ